MIHLLLLLCPKNLAQFRVFPANPDKFPTGSLFAPQTSFLAPILDEMLFYIKIEDIVRDVKIRFEDVIQSVNTLNFKTYSELCSMLKDLWRCLDVG